MRLPSRSTALPTPDADCARGDRSVRRQSPDPAGRRIGRKHRHYLRTANLPPAITLAARHQAAEIITIVKVHRHGQGAKGGTQSQAIGKMNTRGAGIVISQRPNRVNPIPIDLERYKWRHLIENFFCKLKEFKRIAMRADKTDGSFTALIYLAAAVINSK